MSDLRLELSALGRLSMDLQRLGMELKLVSETPSSTATPDVSVDMPSLVAARRVSIETIPGREAAVANRFIEVGYLADHARTCFTDAEDDRAAVITSGASLLPTD